MNFKSLTISSVAIVLFCSDTLHSGCLACWKLYRAEITLKNDKRYEVYVKWNDEWLYDQFYLKETDKSFPDVLFKLRTDSGIDRIWCHEYYDLRSVDYPQKGLIVALGEPLEISIDSLKSITLKDGPFNTYLGAGPIPVVDSRIASLLMTPPAAMCNYDTGASDVYWLSYNHDVDQEGIRWLCKEPLRSLVNYHRGFQNRNIIKIEFAYD